MNADVMLPASVHSIPETLAFWAAQTPDAPALIVPGGPAIGHATLWHRARAVAEFLASHGIGRHDRVALLLPEGPVATVALLGTMSAAIAVPLRSSLTAPELRLVLGNLNASAALVMPTAEVAIRECFAEHAVPVFALQDDHEPHLLTMPAAAARPAADLAWPSPGDITILRQTSGTTSAPKRVARAHGDLIGFGRDHRDLFGLNRENRVPAIAPLSTTLGQTVLMHAIVSGGAIICPPSDDIGLLWDAVVAARPAWMSVSAGFLELLAHLLRGRPSAPGPSSLRFVQVTSAPISAAACDELARRLGAPILPRYSSTEAGGIAMTFPPPAKGKPGSAGQLLQEVRIVDALGSPVRSGTDGEIWVRGPKVSSGYVDDPAATAAAFLPDGWFRTGDVGHLDEEGFLFLTGRANELVNRGGDKIAPMEVDAVLRSHPAVHDAAAFAVPDTLLGEDIVAAVVLEHGQTTTARELRAWMIDRLSRHKVPRRIWFLDALPYTSTGKVQRGKLADRFIAGHSAERKAATG
jgi:acyl-CoA synthetase (AMP-forming)/AMP-acid ligase II